MQLSNRSLPSVTLTVKSGNDRDTSEVFLSSKRPTQHPVTDTIVGMFLVLDTTDHEQYRTGHIVAAVGNCYLIQFDKLEEDHPLPPMELHTLGELGGTCQNCGQKLANLFKTRADMVRWIAWLNKPEKPAGQSGKVVHLKKPH